MAKWVGVAILVLAWGMACLGEDEPAVEPLRVGETIGYQRIPGTVT